ncbi:flagellin N-terminal helical domain-containing protein [Rhodovulum adriaticum]|uniref:Flagellin n=1 Tax=Rhodovulum adriaticum TaxID=35804 RepID=A0A4R2NZQ1_RHOAD|nr:flagellin [Rhodovulum adriaticum]MBK1634758.1 flagellin [Rhodovulum adriaticum]TCP27667.1 flagellin [Rhodovulum adriaticum]
MSSILTNSSATVALQTLKSINSNLSKTQDEISTGKSISSAKDNAAVFAIAKVMESDVTGFTAISESLALGQSTMGVAMNAAEQTGELLQEIKGKIISANESNVDRDKLQSEIASLREQIGGIVGAAQFNGLNLLSNTSKTAGSGSVDILASLDRASDGTVSTKNITVGKQDLGQGAAADAGSEADTNAGTDFSSTNHADGDTAAIATFTASSGSGATGSVEAGRSFVIASGSTYNAGSSDIVYVARDGDTIKDVAQQMANRLSFTAEAAGNTDFTFAVNSNGQITAENNSGAAVADDGSAISEADAGETGGTIGGGLELLSQVDVSTKEGAEAALSAIEGLMQTSVGAQASFGTSARRIEIQSDFISTQIDTFKAGIGSLVDANMEETAARLQSLQVQQQLGVQALSIANSAPQTILSLFR